MKRMLVLCAALLVTGLWGLAFDLSGEWATRVTFASGAAVPESTFTLNLTGGGWEVSNTWNLAAPALSVHTFAFQGSLGSLGVSVGASFRLSTPGGAPAVQQRQDLGLWSADGFTFRSGFVSFDLALGNLTLRLTLHSGSGE